MAKPKLIVNRKPGDREHCGTHVAVGTARAVKYSETDVIPPACNLVVGTIYADGHAQISNAFLSPEECRRVARELEAQANRLEAACSDWERTREEIEGNG